MKKIFKTFLLIFFTSTINAQNTYYVSPAGDDNNNGSFAQPWATPIKAGMTAEAGDTVYFMGGTYHTGLFCKNSGSEQEGYITYSNYQNDTVIFDGAGVPNYNNEYNVWFEGFICNGDPSLTERAS